MVAQSPPYALQNAQHSAALFRQAVSSPFAAGGVLAQVDLAVTAQSTPNMSVQVAAGRVWIPGTQVANVAGGNFTTQAAYFGLNDAPVTLTVSAADPTNPRIDLVYVAVADSFYSGAANSLTLGIVTGTPAATPAAPAAPSNALSLGLLAVSANATSVGSGNITKTAQLGVLRGGILTCTSTTRPSSPAATQVIVESDTNRLYEWNGSAWVYLGGGSSPRSALTINGGWGAWSGHAAYASPVPGGQARMIGWFSNGGSYTPNGTGMPVTIPAGTLRPAADQVFLIPWAGGGQQGIVISTLHASGTYLGSLTIDSIVAGPTSIPAGSAHFLDSIVYDVAYTGATGLS